MRSVLRILLPACLAVALARAVVFVGYAALDVFSPFDVYHLEAQMVHLCWRAQHGRVLYPDWRSYPHVLDVFGPLYHLAVGGIGRLLDLDLDGLYRAGRLVTIGAATLAAVLVGIASGRREGRGAGLFAGLLALGSAPMAGFGAMVRCDVAADLLGFAGFLLAVGRGPRWRAGLGAALLVSSIFTKQTTGLYLVAAVLACGLSGLRRRAIAVAAGSGAATLAIVAAVTLLVEPNFARDLFGAAETPPSPADWALTLSRLVQLGPELPALAMVGVALWLGRAPRDVPMATLAAVFLGGGVLMASKSGSDLNYFLGLRLAAALAAGAVFGTASRLAGEPSGAPLRSTGPMAVVLALLLVGLLPSLDLMSGRLQAGWARHRYLQTAGRPALVQLRQIFRLAEDPGVALLTDSGMVAARQGDRAAFVDPWLFRILVVEGAIEPVEIRRRLESASYDYVITTKDLHDAADPYDSYTFGLPPELAEAARRNYQPAGFAAGLFVYEPRR